MKKLNLMLAVLSILAIVAFAGPALAQNWETETDTHTVGSKFFGFAPTASNISTFMDMNLSLSNADGTLWTSDDYIRGTFMPGAWTSRADRTINTLPDFGCGFLVIQENNCVETGGGQNNVDRILTDGGNTAPLGANFSGTDNAMGGANNGVLQGDMVSFVSLDDVDPDMPFGVIQFSRSANLFQTIYQNISHNLSGLYSWNETDSNSAPIPVFTLGRNLGFGTGDPMNLTVPIHTIMTLTQTGMGNDVDCTLTTLGVCGDSVLNNTIDWTGNGAHPGNNQFFTPGLNVNGTVGGGAGGDWAGNGTIVDNVGFP
jgi:hypothetical protein